MGPTPNTTKKACIATAIVLLGLGVFAAPTAAADDPTPHQNQDGGVQSQDGDCYYIDPWGPGAGVDPWECI